MSKVITQINQLDEGGINPKSGVHEDKLWELNFEDEDSRILGRTKVLEYLTKGTVPSKTAHSFKLWSIKTSSGNTIRTWVVVYDDHSHVQLINKDFYSILTSGHRNKDEEKEKREGNRGPISTAVVQAQQQAQEESQSSVTTAEDRIKVDAFRTQVKEEEGLDFNKFKSEEAYRELIKKDALLHPDAKGLADTK